MAMTCEDALANNLLLGAGESGKKTTSDSGSLPLDGGDKLGDKSLEDVLNDAARKINNLDCPEIVYQWLKNTKPFSYAVSFMGTMKSAASAFSGEALKTTMQSSTIAEGICGVITNVYAVLVETIEIATKAAFALFDAIDSARQRLQAATKNLVQSVMQCIMNVMDMIELFLCNILKLSLVVDWNGLQMFMADCPCICKFIAWLTGCEKDKDGNDISNKAAAVILCIREKFSFIDAAQVGAALSSILNNYVKKYLIFLFDAINMCINILFTQLIIPLRALIKQYVALLRKKWDLTFIIDGMRSTGLDCLLIYTEEKNKDGTTYYGMSVLDMIATLKSWIPCLEYPCKSLGEKIKNKVKKFNKDLRLDGENWSREFECDIYAICMRMDLQSDESMSEYLKKMSKKWKNLLDNLNSKKMQAKHCADNEDNSTFDGAGGPKAAVDDARKMFGAIPEDNSDPVMDAAIFSETQNKEFAPNNGFKPLTTNEDKKILMIGQNIYDASKDGDEFFIELWYQYLRFIGRYRMFDPSFKDVCKLANSLFNLEGQFSGTSTTQFTQYSTTRPKIEFSDIPLRRVNYFFTSDYVPSTATSIMTKPVEPKRPSESLAAYYGRIYSATV